MRVAGKICSYDTGCVDGSRWDMAGVWLKVASKTMFGKNLEEIRGVVDVEST